MLLNNLVEYRLWDLQGSFASPVRRKGANFRSWFSSSWPLVVKLSYEGAELFSLPGKARESWKEEQPS